MPSNTIDYTIGSDPVLKIMAKSLKKQAAKACVKRTFVNTLRCTEREPPQFETKLDALVFAWGELLQNPADHMKNALADARCKPDLADDGNRIDWLLEGAQVLAVAKTADGIDVVQVGLPLSLNCIGTGTAQKTTGGEAESDTDDRQLDESAQQSGNSEAGGFGDGSKTAFVSMLYYGYDCRYIFLFYSKDSPSMVLEWHWIVGVFDDFTEKHMAVQVQFREATAEELQLPHRPTMITRVTKTASSEGSDVLERGFVGALCRFQSLMYTTEPERSDVECITAKGFGAWQHSSVYVPKVDTFMGYNIKVPTKERCSLVLVGGIFYHYKDYRAPRNLVIIVVGKGIPGSQFQVFTTQLREISDVNLKSVWFRQYNAFYAEESNRDALTAGFLPLLRGGASHLIDQHPHGLVTNMLYDSYVCTGIRKMLLFYKLSPRLWGSNKTEQRHDVAKRVEQAILVTDYTHGKALYYQFLCGRSNNVVTIDQRVANSMVFRPVAIDEMEREASAMVLKDANSRNSKISEKIGNEFRKAVQYICGKGVDVSVVIVTEDPGNGISPIHFRYGNTVVLYQPVPNCEHLITILQPQLRSTPDESARAMQFVLHFFGNEARPMTVSKRVAYAIKQATLKLPYDIGDSSGRKRPASSDSDDSSDSSDSDEDYKKLINKKHKPPGPSTTTTTGNGKQKAPHNIPRVSAPPSQMRKIPKGIGGVGGDGSAPACDTDDFECCSLAWNDDLSVFLPDDQPVSVPYDLVKTMAIFNRCVDLVREKIDTGRCQIYAAVAPGESWRGLHQHNGTVLINLAFAKDSPTIIGVIVHELAHEKSSYHDKTHGSAMQSVFATLLGSMLPF